MRFARASLLPVMLASVVLASCGSSDDSSTTPAASTTADAGAFPVTLANQFGTTTIDSRPTRVATVGFNEADFALALGVKPVAVRQFLGSFPYKTRPWAGDQGSPTEVGGGEIDFEKVAAARPDVILGIYSFIKKGDYGKLSQIAPTVAQTKKYSEGGTPWDQQLLSTGTALGLEAKAKQVVADVDAKFAAARKAHPEFEGKTITILFEYGTSKFLLNRDDLRSQFFSSLGFVTPAKYTGSGFEENISSEQLDRLDTDVLLFIPDSAGKLAKTRIFKNLRVSREGRVVTLAGDGNSAGALGYNSPLSRPYLLDQIVPRLAAAVDGDPATTVPAES